MALKHSSYNIKNLNYSDANLSNNIRCNIKGQMITNTISFTVFLSFYTRKLYCEQIILPLFYKCISIQIGTILCIINGSVYIAYKSYRFYNRFFLIST